MSLKNPVTLPGMDPGTVRLVAQRLNHYATPSPPNIMYLSNFCSIPCSFLYSDQFYESVFIAVKNVV